MNVIPWLPLAGVLGTIHIEVKQSATASTPAVRRCFVPSQRTVHLRVSQPSLEFHFGARHRARESPSTVVVDGGPSTPSRPQVHCYLGVHLVRQAPQSGMPLRIFRPHTCRALIDSLVVSHIASLHFCSSTHLLTLVLVSLSHQTPPYTTIQ